MQPVGAARNTIEGAMTIGQILLFAAAVSIGGTAGIIHGYIRHQRRKRRRYW